MVFPREGVRTFLLHHTALTSPFPPPLTHSPFTCPIVFNAFFLSSIFCLPFFFLPSFLFWLTQHKHLPLHFAISKGNVEALQFFLDYDRSLLLHENEVSWYFVFQPCVISTLLHPLFEVFLLSFLIVSLLLFCLPERRTSHTHRREGRCGIGEIK